VAGRRPEKNIVGKQQAPVTMYRWSVYSRQPGTFPPPSSHPSCFLLVRALSLPRIVRTTIEKVYLNIQIFSEYSVLPAKRGVPRVVRFRNRIICRKRGDGARAALYVFITLRVLAANPSVRALSAYMYTNAHFWFSIQFLEEYVK
jgi:hypothetical protein